MYVCKHVYVKREVVVTINSGHKMNQSQQPPCTMSLMWSGLPENTGSKDERVKIPITRKLSLDHLEKNYKISDKEKFYKIIKTHKCVHAEREPDCLKKTTDVQACEKASFRQRGMGAEISSLLPKLCQLILTFVMTHVLAIVPALWWYPTS